jgi:hypothetical protein
MSSNALRKEEVAHPEQRRVRACLKCNDKFESAWAGERVCRKCKGGSSWQSSGLDAVGSRTGSGRR